MGCVVCQAKFLGGIASEVRWTDWLAECFRCILLPTLEFVSERHVRLNSLTIFKRFVIASGVNLIFSLLFPDPNQNARFNPLLLEAAFDRPPSHSPPYQPPHQLKLLIRIRGEFKAWLEPGLFFHDAFLVGKS